MYVAIPIDELFHRTTISDSSSDSDQSKKARSSYVRPGSTFTVQSKKKLQRVINEINTKLEQGQDIDLSEYPPLYVAHFRGIHFFKQFFTQEERQEIRQQIKDKTLQQGSYSPAVYELAGLSLGEPIDTKKKKKKVKQAIAILNEEFDLLADTKPKESNWWGKKASPDSELFQLYQRYVNCYAEFRDENGDKTHSCYQHLSADSNPFVSSAEGADHAVAYAMGGKADLSHNPLRPGYDAKLRPKHPKVGYVEVILHALTSLKDNRHLPLSTLQASRKIHIKTRTLDERETTFWAAIKAEHIVDRQIVRFPSMNISFSSYSHEKYGFLNDSSYQKFKNSLLERKQGSTLVARLKDHYAEMLKNVAAEAAYEMGEGYVVCMGLDGKIQVNLPTKADITSTKASSNAEAVYDQYTTNVNHFCEKIDEEIEPERESDSEVEEVVVELKKATISNEVSNAKVSPSRTSKKNMRKPRKIRSRRAEATRDKKNAQAPSKTSKAKVSIKTPEKSCLSVDSEDSAYDSDIEIAVNRLKLK